MRLKRLFWTGLALLGVVSSLGFLYKVLPRFRAPFDDESAFARGFRAKAEYEASVLAAVEAMRARPLRKGEREWFVQGPRPRRVRTIDASGDDLEAILGAFAAFAVDFVLFHMGHVVPVTSVRGSAAGRDLQVVADMPGGTFSVKSCADLCALVEFDPLEDMDVCVLDKSRTRKFPKASLDQAIVIAHLLGVSLVNDDGSNVQCAVAPMRRRNEGMSSLIIYGMAFRLNAQPTEEAIRLCDLGPQVIKVLKDADRLEDLVEAFLHKSAIAPQAFSQARLVSYIETMRLAIKRRRSQFLERVQTECNPVDDLADDYSR